jgi:outer membrane protein assembly factor BamB
MPARFVSCLLLLLTSAVADWPEFMGPTRNQVSPERGLRDSLPAPVVWEKQIGTGYSAPSVRDGMLVLHHRVGGEEIVEAMDAATGKTRWRHAYASAFTDPFGYNNGPRCTPLLTEDRCYTFGAEGVLLCTDRATGKPVWRRETQRDWEVPEAFFGVGSSPVLEDGRLFVMVGGQPNSGVVAFDAATGETLWENVGEKTWTGVPMTGWPGERTVVWNRSDPAFEKQASYCAPVLATVHGRRLLLCVMRQGLVALDPLTGRALFSYWFRVRQDASVNAMTPVVSGDLVFLSTAYYRGGSVLLRVRPDCAGVEEVWRGTQLEIHWTTPVLADGHLYAFSGRDEPDGRFRSVEFETGRLKWDLDERWPRSGRAKIDPADAPKVFGRGSAILADGKLIVLGEAGLLGLFRLDPERPEPLGPESRWQVPGLTYPCWAAPVLSEGLLYLRSEERLVCLDFRSKKTAGSENTAHPGR